jgi:HTH-type transcriptional regulator / antitoxin HigA
MATRRPAEVFPPGEFLRDELEERGWTQTDLAEIIGRPVSLVNGIIMGKRGISPETARDLSAALGTTPEFWMNLDSAYQLSRIKQDDGSAISRRAKVYETAPVQEMVRRGWIEPSDDVSMLERRVAKFFGVDNLDEEIVFMPHAARKSTSYDQPMTPAQRAWLFRARQLAHAVHADPYSPEGFGEAIDKLLKLRQTPQELRRVPHILSDAGIRLVIVQPLAGTRIDGACFWIDEGPVVAMSIRFDRIDNFWFVLFHELRHVSQGIDSLDTDLDAAPDSGRPEVERDADEFAVMNLVPQHHLENFISQFRPLYSTRSIEAFAHTMGVHPGIVVGQLQHRGEVAYASFRKTLVPVREWITSSAATDGWGAALPARF